MVSGVPNVIQPAAPGLGLTSDQDNRRVQRGLFPPWKQPYVVRVTLGRIRKTRQTKQVDPPTCAYPPRVERVWDPAP
jgi:hypothetical protein